MTPGEKWWQGLPMRYSPAERLAQARKRAGFETAAEAIRHHKWKPSTYNAHENGQNGLTRAAAQRYGEAFRVDWKWLMALEEAGETPQVGGTAPTFKANYSVKPEVSIWGAAIEAALLELGVERGRAERVTEIILSVAYAQLPVGLGMTEVELAQHLVREALRRLEKETGES